MHRRRTGVRTVDNRSGWFSRSVPAARVHFSGSCTWASSWCRRDPGSEVSPGRGLARSHTGQGSLRVERARARASRDISARRPCITHARFRGSCSRLTHAWWCAQTCGPVRTPGMKQDMWKLISAAAREPLCDSTVALPRARSRPDCLAAHCHGRPAGAEACLLLGWLVGRPGRVRGGAGKLGAARRRRVRVGISLASCCPRRPRWRVRGCREGPRRARLWRARGQGVPLARRWRVRVGRDREGPRRATGLAAVPALVGREDRWRAPGEAERLRQDPRRLPGGGADAGR